MSSYSLKKAIYSCPCSYATCYKSIELWWYSSTHSTHWHKTEMSGRLHTQDASSRTAVESRTQHPTALLCAEHQCGSYFNNSDITQINHSLFNAWPLCLRNLLFLYYSNIYCTAIFLFGLLIHVRFTGQWKFILCITTPQFCRWLPTFWRNVLPPTHIRLLQNTANCLQDHNPGVHNAM
jgi:hypothetical protein